MNVRWLARGMHEVPESPDWLSAVEAARLETLRFPKRRTEVRLARWTAKQAIATALDLERHPASLASIEVRAAATGAPLPFVADSPAPVSVSMTDRADWAVCVVASPDVGIGCDLELVEPRSEAFLRDWFTPAEQRLIEEAPVGEPRHMLANLVWSAKESALKVLQTGLRRATRSVEVDVIDRTGHEWTPLVVRAVEGTVFPGWWRRYGEFLLTVATDRPSAPPVSLEEPPGLAHATPSHSWLPKR